MQFKQGSGGSNPSIIKLKDGTSVTGVLRGEPFEYEKSFTQPGKPPGKPAYKFRLNLITKEEGVMVAKILEGGWKLRCQLEELMKAGWDLEKTYTKISRAGSGINDTVYSASVLPSPVSAAALAEVEKIPLKDLNPYPNNNVPAPGPLSPNFQTEEDLPF